MIGGITNIRYAASANLTEASKSSAHYYAKTVSVTGNYAEICDTDNGTIQLNRTIQNGCALYDDTLTFRTLTDPGAFVNAKSFVYADGQGRTWILGWDDPDDYPTVTWSEENKKGQDVAYLVTVQMKSRVGVMRVQ